ncbi:MAG: Cof-type HAD-IIB family hydrolase [Chloroflexi bacterium AL-W]|nr:Cof-type HAD-IIB family hydrolase [Chloroflexi bacterium AL-N1]NOK67015.1 Cof-type HAD-IIB family hydrolase [Chloroflexi bacterium AL-N10]NOK74693.1 Cof-type HAD-IIB family hydrolase [Chloroflexi bacterium AL-N5]NOK81617.1 Cof-type HAD-IIB family hydrolase [Chloroflexi bacterium AL-W]NOK89087.1 Cof-type HAD-IIB family hydrolase [Chloroflexi bacterium AL-N15]
MSYRLVALDLDGTVIDGDLMIPVVTQQAVHAAQVQGVRVTLATGRPFYATLPFAQQLNITEPLICYQGAMIRHPITQEVFTHVGMPRDLAAEAITLLLRENIYIIVYIDERLWMTERRPELDQYLALHPDDVEIMVVDDLSSVIAAHAPTKVLLVAEPAVVEREVVRLAHIFDGRLAAIRSHAIFGELTAPGISKGQALAQLATSFEIPREQVLAIGDQENDLSMIEWAGLGLAMGNAVPAVRAAAAAVLPSVRDAGVAWAFERYVLNVHPLDSQGSVSSR